MMLLIHIINNSNCLFGMADFENLRKLFFGISQNKLLHVQISPMSSLSTKCTKLSRRCIILNVTEKGFYCTFHWFRLD